MDKLIYILLFVVLSNFVLAESNFSGERLKEACLQYVISKVGESEVKFLTSVNNLKFNEDGVSAEISHSSDLIGVTKLNLIFKKDKQIIETKSVSVKIITAKDIFIFSNDLNFGDIISANDIILVKKYSDKVLINNPEYIVGKKLTRNVQKGLPVEPQHLETVPIIERGDKVSILAISGKVVVSTGGEALSDAKVGEILRVRKSNSQKVYEGIALADGSVKINR